MRPKNACVSFSKNWKNFRAAVVQILGLKVPDGAVKTQLILFRSKRDFREVTQDRDIAAFVSGLDGVPYMVMPAGQGNISSWYLRHEYTHVLLGYGEVEYPSWYNEGFAEFMSGTEFKKKGTIFTLGDQIPRVQIGRLLVPWDELVRRDFDVHAISSSEKGSNAYYQSWMLTHYLTLGEDLRNSPKLARYLVRFSAGQDSAAAFEAEFGMTPTELGRRAMREYSHRMPFYKVPFQPGMQDLEFTRSDADQDAIKETIRRFEGF